MQVVTTIMATTHQARSSPGSTSRRFDGSLAGSKSASDVLFGASWNWQPWESRFSMTTGRRGCFDPAPDGLCYIRTTQEVICA